MNREDKSKIAGFEQWTRKIIAGNRQVLRFTYKPHASREDVLEHEAKTLRLAMLLITFEWKAGNPHDLDFVRLLYCAGTHDDGEGVTGVDHHAMLKTEQDQEYENHHYEQLLDQGIPGFVRDLFRLPIDQDDEVDETHRLFWNALEKTGYVFFALGELREEEQTGFTNPQRIADFIAVGQHYREELLFRGETFISINVVCRIQYQELDRLIREIQKTGIELPAPNL